MNRTKWMVPAVIAAMLALAAAPLAAQTPIDETRPLDTNGTLFVSNVSGSVTVTGWGGGEVQITGTLGKGAEELRITGDTSRLDVEVKLPKHSKNVRETHLEINVPAGCRLIVDTVSADIEVSGMIGDIEFESVSGDIQAACGAGDVEISTVSGQIRLECQSTSTDVQTVSGDARLTGISERLSSESVSGDFIVSGGIFSDIHAETVSGDLQFDIGLEGNARVEIEAHSGDVVFLLDDLSIHCSVETFSGSITNEFGWEGVSDKYSKGTVHWEAPAGSGSGKLDIETFSGDVMLKRK